jgi:hypothetical protein
VCTDLDQLAVVIGDLNLRPPGPEDWFHGESMALRSLYELRFACKHRGLGI